MFKFLKAYIRSMRIYYSAKQYNITIANMSFGASSRQKTEELYAKKGCGQVDLRAYYQALATVDKQVSDYTAQTYPDINKC